MKFKSTNQDGTTTFVDAEIHNGYLCRKVYIPNGFVFVQKRVNDDPYDDDEPEYKKVKRQKFREVLFPLLSKKMLQQDGKIKEAIKFRTCIIKTAKSYADFKEFKKYFLQVGENTDGQVIEKII